ncbi:MAG: MFS transporter [Candidatus Promineifilaceae bacterium]|jgi:MFS family permease
MCSSVEREQEAPEGRRFLIQRRVSAVVDHLRPQRWNWYALVRPLDVSLQRQAQIPVTRERLRDLRYFWIDGLFAAISENFYLGFVALFALAYGATNSQVGLMAASANLLGAAALFPGAQLVERSGKRKAVAVWSGGVFGRLALLGLAIVPFLFTSPTAAIVAIIVLDGLRSFMFNFGNPAWTSLVADLVPEGMRARFFSSRNIAMGLAAMVVATLAGWLISRTNARLDSAVVGYQLVFLFAFATGMVSTYAFWQIREPQMAEADRVAHQRGDLRRVLHQNPAFTGLIISALVWNFSLQLAAPFFSVYLVNGLGASAAVVGVLASVSSLTALFGQRYFASVIDRRGPYWVQGMTSLFIPLAPWAWMLVRAPWQVGIINAFVGFAWAGYNLANFNLLLELTPKDHRARAVALYQVAVFSSAVVGPLLGGFLADQFGYKFIFMLSGIGRYAGAVLFFGLTYRLVRNKSR